MKFSYTLTSRKNIEKLIFKEKIACNKNTTKAKFLFQSKFSVNLYSHTHSDFYRVL